MIDFRILMNHFLKGTGVDSDRFVLFALIIALSYIYTHKTGWIFRFFWVEK